MKKVLADKWSAWCYCNYIGQATFILAFRGSLWGERLKRLFI